MHNSVFFFLFIINSGDDAVIVSSYVLKHGSTLSSLMSNRFSCCGTSHQIKACPLLCFNSFMLCVCVCELLASFIPAAVCWHVCMLFWCTQTYERGCLCVRHVYEWSLTSCPYRTRVHTLTPSHLLLYMCPPGGHPLSVSVFIEQTLNTPRPPVYVYAEWNPFTMEISHVLIPSSFPLSRLFAGCVRDMFASEQVSSPLDKRVVQHPFHLDSPSGVDAPEKHCQKIYK